MSFRNFSNFARTTVLSETFGEAKYMTLRMIRSPQVDGILDAFDKASNEKNSE